MPPPIPHPPSERVSFPKGLPWAPKVRYCPVSPNTKCNEALQLVLYVHTYNIKTCFLFDVIVFAPAGKKILKISWNQVEVNSSVTLLEGSLFFIQRYQLPLIFNPAIFYKDLYFVRALQRYRHSGWLTQANSREH